MYTCICLDCRRGSPLLIGIYSDTSIVTDDIPTCVFTNGGVPGIVSLIFLFCIICRLYFTYCCWGPPCESPSKIFPMMYNI